jgi:hypothetical protein
MSIERLLCTMLASCLFVAGTAAPAARPSVPRLDSAITSAVSYCESVAARENIATFPMPIGADMHDATPPALGTPDIVKRFAATQPIGRMAAPSFFVRFPASNGEVWAVLYEGMPACDFMITGADGDMPTLATDLAKSLGATRGWRTMSSEPATGGMPFAQLVLVKRMPRTGTPEFALRASIRALSASIATKEGVQLDMSFLAGKIGTGAPVSQ